MKQILQSFPLGPLVGAGETPTVRMSADSQFQALTGEVHPAGDFLTNYTEIALTQNGDNWDTEEITVDTTDDSSDPNVTYSMWVADSNGREFYALFERWAFSASWGDSIDWAQLESSNVDRAPLRDDQAYSKIQSNYIYQTHVAPDWSTSVKGKGKIAADGGTTAGTAVQANDSRLIASSTQSALSSLTSAIAGTLRSVTDGLRGVWRKVATTNLWISLTGYANVKDFGAYGDGSHDDTVAIQATINAVAAAGGGTVYFPDGTYIIGGALQDVSLSNAQLVLPKVSTLASEITVKLAGTTPPPTPWNCDSGVILKSTLSSGNGVMIGVKNNQGSGVATASAYMSNASSNIVFAMENITLQLPINPTNSALDIGHVRNYDLPNNRIVTGDFAQGGANPVVSVGTAIPDLAVTTPTTTTSYGINLPTNLINNGNIDGLFIAGFYTAIRTGELAKGRNIVIHCCNVGFQVEGGIWWNVFQNVVIAGTARPIKATGAKPEQTGFPDTVNTAIVYFEHIGVENDAVNTVVYVVDDVNGYLHGRGDALFYGAGADVPTNPAVLPNFVMTRAERPWNVREPITNITGSPLTADANLFAIDELNRGVPVSNNSGLPWRIFTTNQSGVGFGVGVEVFANSAIAAPDKRLYQRFVTTDGTIDSGLLSEYIMSAGALNLARTFDRYGNLNFAMGFIRSGEATLAITSNTIAPTTPIVHVTTTNTLKNITVPAGSAASFTVRLIPDAAWPYDNTGNIVGTGTAVVGRPMDATYTPSTGKFYMSY